MAAAPAFNLLIIQQPITRLTTTSTKKNNVINYKYIQFILPL